MRTGRPAGVPGGRVPGRDPPCGGRASRPPPVRRPHVAIVAVSIVSTRHGSGTVLGSTR